VLQHRTPRAFAESMVADMALRIDEIERRPILVFERAPDRMTVVDNDRVIDPMSRAERRTSSRFFSNLNSGACTPMTANPRSLYLSAHART
jgi:hypothetical protein